MKSVKFFVCLLLAQFCSMVAFAQNVSRYSTEHLAAAERVAYAMGLPERFIIPTQELLQRSREKDRDNAPLMTAVFRPYLEKKYTAEHMRDYFAARFDLTYCRSIADFWEGPVGKKLVRNQVLMLTSGTAPKLVFTAREKTLIKNFEATDAGKAFMLSMPEIEDAMDEFTRTTQTKMREKFLDELKRKLESSSSS
ncbi:MAG: hypothetical protein HYS18_15980 [Burkholderiales bacterium]|nr:hypothetical protein [Burkholderiales bacterium]